MSRYDWMDDGPVPFFLYDGWWYEARIHTGYLVNAVGGKMPHTFTEEDKEKFVYAEERDELDWTLTKVVDATEKTGWLSPEGKFFGCSREMHEDQARYIHKKSYKDLEKLGWVKITEPFWMKPDCKNGLSFHTTKGVNEAQVRVLKTLGFLEEEIDFYGRRS